MSVAGAKIEHMFESVGDGVEQSPGESAFRASGFAGLAGGTAPRSDEQGVAELLESLLSGGSIVAQLPALMSIDRSALSDEESLTFLEILERVIASCHAVQAELLVQLAGPSTHATRILLPDAASGNPGGPGPRVTSVIVIEELVREEIARALRWSVGQTQRRIDAARLLTSTLPGTFASLTSGHISHPHAMVIADAAHRLPGMNAVDGPGREQFARVCALLEHATIPVAHVSAECGRSSPRYWLISASQSASSSPSPSPVQARCSARPSTPLPTRAIRCS